MIFKDQIKKWLDENFSQSIFVKLAGDASSREYFRMHSELHGVSYILGIDEIDYHQKLMTNYTLFKSANVAVPEVKVWERSLGILVWEDLGDRSLTLCAAMQSDSRINYYKMALNEMHKIHQIHQIKCNCGSSPAGLEIFEKSFDKEKLLFEVNMTHEFFLDHLLARVKLSAAERLELEEKFLLIIEVLASLPTVTTHRDFHGRNIIMKQDHIGIIDFQDARQGPVQYDLVSLLEDAYINLTSYEKETLFNYYIQDLNPAFVDMKSEFMFGYKLMAIQRLYKAIGSFSMIYAKRADVRYLKHVGLCFERIRNFLEELQQDSSSHSLKILREDFRRIHDLLCKVYYEQ